MNRPSTGRLGVLLSAALALAAVGGCGPASSGGGAAGAGAGSIQGCPTSQPAALPAGEHRTVTIATDFGSIVIDVAADTSPIATGNFVALAACGYYDKVVFHRIVPGFVIQGGDGRFGRAPGLDRTTIGSGGPGYTIQDEPVTGAYRRGVVAMGHTSRPNSQGSQFFIVLDDASASSLAKTYAIIGTVTAGMDVADKIALSADQEIPTTPIVMDDVSVSTP